MKIEICLMVFLRLVEKLVEIDGKFIKGFVIIMIIIIFRDEIDFRVRVYVLY